MHPQYTPKQIKQFWSRIRIGKPEECWEWQGYRVHHGYGHTMYMVNGKCYHPRSHRLAYYLTFGPIPEGCGVCHRCDNPPCCNPAHLFVGTQKDNANDARLKGRLCPGKIRYSHIRPDRIPRGEYNPRSLLTEAQVREIRKLRADNGLSCRELSALFGVKAHAIYKVVTRMTWKHVYP
jgi:hypothetical protein